VPARTSQRRALLALSACNPPRASTATLSTSWATSTFPVNPRKTRHWRTRTQLIDWSIPNATVTALLPSFKRTKYKLCLCPYRPATPPSFQGVLRLTPRQPRERNAFRRRPRRAERRRRSQIFFNTWRLWINWTLQKTECTLFNQTPRGSELSFVLWRCSDICEHVGGFCKRNCVRERSTLQSCLW